MSSAMHGTVRIDAYRRALARAANFLNGIVFAGKLERGLLCVDRFNGRY